MGFVELLALAKRGQALLSDGRNAMAQVKDAINDGSTALTEKQGDQLRTMLDEEEQETRTAISDARDAIAAYRQG
jgi:polyhydroxyalkanoate synthesis regulator phasin